MNYRNITRPAFEWGLHELGPKPIPTAPQPALQPQVRVPAPERPVPIQAVRAEIEEEDAT